MHHWDVSHRDDFRMIHAVLARCVFGPKTCDIHEGTRERTEHRYNGEPVEALAFSEERCNTWMQKHCDSWRPTWSYWMIRGYHNCIQFWTAWNFRWTTWHVRRACVDNSYQLWCLSLLDTAGQRHTSCLFAKALMSYTDFITGDFNLFANR